jgi:hypothetical protein
MISPRRNPVVATSIHAPYSRSSRAEWRKARSRSGDHTERSRLRAFTLFTFGGSAGRRVQPFSIDDEARNIEDTDFIYQRDVQADAVGGDHLVTGPAAVLWTFAAELTIEALGV